MLVTSHRVSESFGGVEKFVASLSSWCYKRGFNVTVISRTLGFMPVKTTYGPIPECENQKVQVVKTIELPFLFYYIGLSFFSFVLFLNLFKNVKYLRSNRTINP